MCFFPEQFSLLKFQLCRQQRQALSGATDKNLPALSHVTPRSFLLSQILYVCPLQSQPVEEGPCWTLLLPPGGAVRNPGAGRTGPHYSLVFCHLVSDDRDLSKQPARGGPWYQQGKSSFVFPTPCILAVDVLSEQTILLT